MTEEQNERRRKRYFQSFIKRAKDRFGDRFQYDESKYINLTEKMPIKCLFHEVFYATPAYHLKTNSGGCKECKKENNVKRRCHTKETILIKLNEKFGNRFIYDLSTYDYLLGSDIKVICSTHGEFISSPYNILRSKYGCPKCIDESENRNKRYTYEEVVEKIYKKHGDKYTVPESNREKHTNIHSKFDIVCKKHGTFKIQVNYLISGKECQRCTRERTNNPGVYSFKLFESVPELADKPAYLYYLKINGGEYYKIGITNRTVKHRVGQLKSKCRLSSVEIIKYRKLPLLFAFQLEQFILFALKEFRVTAPFSTEVFDRDIYEYIKYNFEED